MKVYVIMGNDFPDCVIADEAAADAYVAAKVEKEKAKLVEPWQTAPRIRWRHYEFELIEKVKEGRSK